MRWRGPSRTRGVRVLFSDPGVLADDPDRLSRIHTFDDLLDAFEYGPGGG